MAIKLILEAKMPRRRFRVANACTYLMALAHRLGVPERVLDRIADRLAAWLVAGVRVSAK